MKPLRVHLKAILASALLFALCAAPALAGVSLLYYVGYGLYPYGATNTVTTAPGTGLLANNGSGRVLMQLIYAGPDYRIGDGTNTVDLANVANGYVAGDDVVWKSTVIAAGTNDTDEWGFSNIPLAYTNFAWSTAGFVFVRVFQDDTPQNGEAFYDTPLFAMNTASTMDGIFGQSFNLDNGPTEGVALDRLIGSTKIQNVEFDPEVSGFAFAVPDGFALQIVYGADTALPSGDWNWQPLKEVTHYTVTDGVVTLPTTGVYAFPRQMIRIGLLPSP
jgi:hypothetical protein